MIVMMMMVVVVMVVVVNVLCRVSHEATPHVDGGSDVESDDDNEDGDYTVFECRGLATVSLVLQTTHTHAYTCIHIVNTHPSLMLH